MNKRISIPTKLRARLQQEINSTCPFCPSEEVGHFEIHHIDENRSNNEYENLIMLCPLCHSKITKKEIPNEEVKKVKAGLGFRSSKIELVSIAVGDDGCEWVEQDKLCFYNKSLNEPKHPVFEFNFINQLFKTVVIKSIKLRVEHFPSGISGLPMASEIPLVGAYKIFIDKEINTAENFNPIQIPGEQAVRFRTVLAYKQGSEIVAIGWDKLALYFSIECSDDIIYRCPTVYLNCKDRNEKINIYVES